METCKNCGYEGEDLLPMLNDSGEVEHYLCDACLLDLPDSEEGEKPKQAAVVRLIIKDGDKSIVKYVSGDLPTLPYHMGAAFSDLKKPGDEWSITPFNPDKVQKWFEDLGVTVIREETAPKPEPEPAPTKEPFSLHMEKVKENRYALYRINQRGQRATIAMIDKYREDRWTVIPYVYKRKRATFTNFEDAAARAMSYAGISAQRYFDVR